MPVQIHKTTSIDITQKQQLNIEGFSTESLDFSKRNNKAPFDKSITDRKHTMNENAYHVWIHFMMSSVTLKLFPKHDV